MKKLNLFAILLILLSLSCNQPAKTEVEETTETEESNINSEIKSEETSLNEENILKLVVEIDLKRLAIESKESEPIEIETTTLREKIKQKWNKIHFYENEGIVVKIKTYPYEDISKRTEEFYADENGLILVVIEDNGLGEKGKTKDTIRLIVI